MTSLFFSIFLNKIHFKINIFVTKILISLPSLHWFKCIWISTGQTNEEDLTDEKRKSHPSTTQEYNSILISMNAWWIKDDPQTVRSKQDTKVKSEPQVDLSTSIML